MFHVYRYNSLNNIYIYIYIYYVDKWYQLQILQKVSSSYRLIVLHFLEFDPIISQVI